MELGSQIWQVAFALLFIVALVLVLGFAAKRVQGLRGSKAGSMQIVDSTALGNKEKLILVQVLNKQVLLGVNQQCIAKLLEFDVPTSSTAAIESAGEFADVLERCAAEVVA